MSDAEDPRRGPRRRNTFLERKTYRRARTEDAAKLLPVLGCFLFFGPIALDSTNMGTSRWLVFFMAVWALLILLAALLSKRLDRTDPGSGDEG